MIVGYFLVAVALNLKGDVVGKSFNYYYTKQNCHTAKVKQEKLSEPEIGYVCIADVLK
tara:strand:- start:284 stop:457 length:174 start_codon:yes stop_codon:yes gene_type:complete